MGKFRAAFVGATVAVFMVSGLAAASHTDTAESHSTVAGNPRCSVGTTSLKLEAGVNLANGTFGPIVISNYNGKTVDWAITEPFEDIFDMAAVIVKGGPNAEVYIYDFDSGGHDDSDRGLTAPFNPNSGKYYGISHVIFCFDPKG